MVGDHSTSITSTCSPAITSPCRSLRASWRDVAGADDSYDGEGWALSPMDVDFCGVLASLVLGLMRSV